MTGHEERPVHGPFDAWWDNDELAHHAFVLKPDHTQVITSELVPHLKVGTVGWLVTVV